MEAAPFRRERLPKDWLRDHTKLCRAVNYLKLRKPKRKPFPLHIESVFKRSVNVLGFDRWFFSAKKFVQITFQCLGSNSRDSARRFCASANLNKPVNQKIDPTPFRNLDACVFCSFEELWILFLNSGQNIDHTRPASTSDLKNLQAGWFHFPIHRRFFDNQICNGIAIPGSKNFAGRHPSSRSCAFADFELNKSFTLFVTILQSEFEVHFVVKTIKINGIF